MHFLKIGGVGELRVIRYQGHESMSRPFEFEVFVTAKDGDVAFSDAVGKTAHLTFGVDEERKRHLHGIVRRFEHSGETPHDATYRALVVPEAWRLTLRRNNRIFQEMSVIDIVKKVLDGASFSAYQVATSGSYATREYCVQYRESDWDFINRLLEHEGIYYFFEHTEGGCKMVIGDVASVHDPITGEATVKFREGGALGSSHEYIYSLHFGEEVRPGKVTMRDYNFKTPTVSLESSSSADAETDLEIYDFPGSYYDGGTGGQLAGNLLEALQARRRTGVGRSSVARLAPGHKFTLEDSPRADFNAEYLLTRVEHRGEEPQPDNPNHVEAYTNTFSVMPADKPFRPDRVTHRPTINGIQTAVVTGPGGEEIHTDEHGRIKVQFHWDREGKKDDKSSCWVRVKQAWAGPGWGSLWIPRIGQEVVIDFIEGDPDRPLCTGAVYHATNVPPYSLPGEKTKSTIKSNSTVGGGGNNELRFDDNKGSEEIWLHGQKDWNIRIEHDQNQEIGNDETRDVGHDQTIKIHHNRSKTVDNDQAESIGGNKGISVKKDHTETISGNESITVKGNEAIAVGLTREVMVGVANAVTVGAAHSLTVGLDLTEKSGGNITQTAGKGMNISVGKSFNTQVKENKKTTIGKNHDLEVTENQTIKVSKDKKEETTENHTIVAGKQWSLQVGDATVKVEKNGNITIQGKEITVKGTGPIKVEGKQLEVDSKGAVTVKASGKVTVKGSAVDMN